MNINETMKELAQWQRMQEEAAAMVEALKDQIKEHMTAAGLEVLTGDEHKDHRNKAFHIRIIRGCNMFIIICLILFPFVLLGEILKQSN